MCAASSWPAGAGTREQKQAYVSRMGFWLHYTPPWPKSRQGGREALCQAPLLLRSRLHPTTACPAAARRGGTAAHQRAHREHARLPVAASSGAQGFRSCEARQEPIKRRTLGRGRG